MDGRTLPLGFFASQPESLLTALCGYRGERVDLLVVPPTTPTRIAEASMALAASATGRIQAKDILATAAAVLAGTQAEEVWEAEGGAAQIRVRPQN